MRQKYTGFKPGRKKMLLTAPLTAALVVVVGAIGLRLTFNSRAATITPMPNKIVGQYLDGWISTLPSDLPAGNNLLFYAFAQIKSDGSAFIEMEQDAASLKSDIAANNAAGKPTILSIGGAGGAQTGLADAASQQKLISTIEPIIDEYGFSGIDWDIEADLPSGGSPSAAGMAAVSRALVDHYGSNFSITMAPYGLTADIYMDLAASIKDILTVVGFQFYNDSSAPTSASVISTLEDWMSTTGISASQFALGFMPSDDSGLKTSYSAMASIYEAVEAKYPTIRGSWTWDTEADQASGWQFVSTMAPVVGPATTTPTPTPPTPTPPTPTPPTPTPPTPTPPNPTPGGSGKVGDLNNDGQVNITDLSMLLSNWQKTTTVGDLNGSGKVDITDLSLLLSKWQKQLANGLPRTPVAGSFLR